MDLFYADKKLSDFGAQFDDILENDMFTPPSSAGSPVMDFSLESGMDQDWLDTFFDDPVLNDRMISDALQPHPQVQSEHSYSLANNEQALDMTIKKEEKDMDTEFLTTTVNPNSMTPTSHTVPPSTAPTSLLTPLSSTHFKPETCSYIKEEPLDPETTMVTVTRTTNPQTLLKPTIILAHTQPTVQHNLANIKERFVLPNLQQTAVSVKVDTNYSLCSTSASSPEISYEQLSLPPTPPSSSTSDSDGSVSPDRSLPSSPVRHAVYQARASYRATPSPPPSAYSSNHQPFFMHPIPSSGVLLLSEEEKRTLITEGYPIPAKLPLSKNEEKNLKKIRRKIKNKISAQESRRKKKEYLESLERKMESFCQENVDLKKKVDNLENSNRSLISQLHKLQTLVGKVRPQNTAGTCVMVLVLCFAVFLGSWSPMSWSVGYSSITPTPGPVGLIGVADTVAAPGVPVGRVGDAIPPGLDVRDTSSDPYGTPTMKSRVLLSLSEEDEGEVYGPSVPFCLHDMFKRWFNVLPAAPQRSDNLFIDPVLPKVETLDVETENNQTGEHQGHFKVMTPPQVRSGEEQAIMHPGIAVMTPSRKQVNATA